MDDPNTALDIGTRLQTKSLTANCPNKLIHTFSVSVVRLNKDASLIAYGDEKGTVTIREVFNTQRRLKLLDAGTPIRDILWHPTDPTVVLIAAANGFVNALTLSQCPTSDVFGATSELKASNDTAVRVKGFITCLGMSPSGTTVAIGFDKSVQIASFPFTGPQDGSSYDGPLLPLEVSLGQHREKDFLAKYHPIPRKIHFISDTFVCVTFLAGAQCFELTNGAWKYAWSMASPPGSFMGSTAVSPSKKVLVASNLTTGLDFYSFATQRFQMSTTANLGFPTKNYTLEADFIDETTVATGSNFGQVPIATNGAVDFAETLGTEQRSPSQSVSTAKTNDNRFLIASACENIISIWHILPSRMPAPKEEQIDDTSLKLEGTSRQSHEPPPRAKKEELNPSLSSELEGRVRVAGTHTDADPTHQLAHPVSSDVDVDGEGETDVGIDTDSDPIIITYTMVVTRTVTKTSTVTKTVTHWGRRLLEIALHVSSGGRYPRTTQIKRRADTEVLSTMPLDKIQLTDFAALTNLQKDWVKLLTFGAAAVRSSSSSYDQMAQTVEAMMAAGENGDIAVLEAIHMKNDVGKLLMNVHLTSMVFKQLWSAGHVRDWTDLGCLPDIPEEAWSKLKIDFPFDGPTQGRRQGKSATSNNRLRGLAYSSLILTPIIGFSTVNIASSSIVRARMIGSTKYQPHYDNQDEVASQFEPKLATWAMHEGSDEDAQVADLDLDSPDWVPCAHCYAAYNQ
ncbi:hypothetical protein MD484_g8991, partial [Candolleomyces efflorescens]